MVRNEYGFYAVGIKGVLIDGPSTAHISLPVPVVHMVVAFFFSRIWHMYLSFKFLSKLLTSNKSILYDVRVYGIFIIQGSCLFVKKEHLKVCVLFKVNVL